jgi:hypothetical protein
MPLKEGSSKETIQHNIEGILDKRYGYDPPYKDPNREEYTPAQAAAIAYAKAGKRKPSGDSESSDSAEETPSCQVLEGWSVV